MKKLLLLPLLFTMFASAEIYEDFAPSQEPMELTVVAVQPNYVDTYLTNSLNVLTSLHICTKLSPTVSCIAPPL